MCWSIEVSAISAAIAWIVCVILWWRNRTVRDRWYAMYLFTFTFTQVRSAAFDSLHIEQERARMLTTCVCVSVGGYCTVV